MFRFVFDVPESIASLKVPNVTLQSEILPDAAALKKKTDLAWANDKQLPGLPKSLDSSVPVKKGKFRKHAAFKPSNVQLPPLLIEEVRQIADWATHPPSIQTLLRKLCADLVPRAIQMLQSQVKLTMRSGSRKSSVVCECEQGNTGNCGCSCQAHVQIHLEFIEMEVRQQVRAAIARFRIEELLQDQQKSDVSVHMGSCSGNHFEVVGNNNSFSLGITQDAFEKSSPDRGASSVTPSAAIAPINVSQSSAQQEASHKSQRVDSLNQSSSPVDERKQDAPTNFPTLTASTPRLGLLTDVESAAEEENIEAPSPKKRRIDVSTDLQSSPEGNPHFSHSSMELETPVYVLEASSSAAEKVPSESGKPGAIEEARSSSDGNQNSRTRSNRIINKPRRYSSR
jgi:hypothetical protein